ncbi:hypothetical protein PC121_g14927 [Phytophthora cactorum]|nr:hypothetical protein PC120_g13577 [Phytophthora cactorum]KAG3057260.1 hypothetical protein PC121_g14927 [Phytophthora cactorum]
MWQAQISKHQNLGAKLLVAFLKLLLEDGFTLKTKTLDYRDHVLKVVKRVEEAVFAFLAERGIPLRGFGAVLKYLRTLHRSGGLNNKIERYQLILQTAAIKNPAPRYTQTFLEKS